MKCMICGQAATPGSLAGGVCSTCLAAPLAHAKKLVLDGAPKGVDCPCCTQFCKIYLRSLNVNMALSLLGVVTLYEERYDWIPLVHIDRFVRGIRPHTSYAISDLGKLTHWDLIFSAPNTDQKKRTSGMWKPTQKGRDFAHKRIAVPLYVRLFNNNLLGFVGPDVFVDTTLRKKFDYREILKEKP